MAMCEKCKSNNLIETENGHYCCNCGWDSVKKDYIKRMTNADRIRSMNDEELAKFIRAVECCSRYSADCGFPFCPSMEGNLCNGIKEKTEQYILDWLQSEVKGSE